MHGRVHTYNDDKQVYYDKMQNGDEYFGTAVISTSTIISIAGQVMQEWVKLSRGKDEVGQVRRQRKRRTSHSV